MKKLVRLWKRPSRDGKMFVFVLDYRNEQGKRRQVSLGHADVRKAKRQRDQKERELRMGFVEPESMRLSEFLEDSIARTRGQVRDSTIREVDITVRDFIQAIGNRDYQTVSHKHGELFLQHCLDRGNAPATAAKKLRHLKRVFQLAVDRSQLNENPLRRVKSPKVPKKKVRTFTSDQCTRLLKAAHEYQQDRPEPWEILIHLALCTGMRRGELLNTTWRDIDFARQTVEVSPKAITSETWEWHIKDVDRRSLPLTKGLVVKIAEFQSQQPEGYPYLFIPPSRYDHIQALRQQGRWTLEKGRCPLHNFTRHFQAILKKAAISEGEFHDLRRTCLSNWIACGLSEFDVMNLAGHSCFETTRTFYLNVRTDALDRARQASQQADSAFLLRACCAPLIETSKEKNDDHK
jgi:integrase